MVSVWPSIDFGHSGRQAAFERRDVHDVTDKAGRAARHPPRVAIAVCGGVTQAKWAKASAAMRVFSRTCLIEAIRRSLGESEIKRTAEGYTA